jgi:hypothetical protein
MSHVSIEQVHRFLDLEAQVDGGEELDEDSELGDAGNFHSGRVLSGCSLVFRRLYRRRATG